jgi:hypothetical protein
LPKNNNVKESVPIFTRETKPTESKPTETKPTENKSTENKPTETKSTENKPTESKPTESKPTENKPNKFVNRRRQRNEDNRQFDREGRLCNYNRLYPHYNGQIFSSPQKSELSQPELLKSEGRSSIITDIPIANGQNNITTNFTSSADNKMILDYKPVDTIISNPATFTSKPVVNENNMIIEVDTVIKPENTKLNTSENVVIGNSHAPHPQFGENITWLAASR